MKKSIKSVLLVVAIFAFVFVIAGCGKKDGIVGKWQSKDYGSTFTYEFKEDGTGSYVGQKFTYKIDGNKISILYDGNTASFDTTFEIKDDTLNIKDSLGEDTLYKRVN